MNQKLMIGILLCCFLLKFGLESHLYRNYDVEEYCIQHTERNHLPSEFKDFVHLIPAQKMTKICHCNFIHCPACHSTPIFFNCEKWKCKCTKGFTIGVNPSVQFPILEGFDSISCRNGWHTNWTSCPNGAIYPGYFDYHESFQSFDLFRSYFLHYALVHQECQCLWPETSELAAEISNTAYHLFKKLLRTTALSILALDSIEKSNFLLKSDVVSYEQANDFDSRFCFSKDCFIANEDDDDYEEQLTNYKYEITAVLFVRHCFFYSDYSDLCDKLESYGLNHFQRDKYLKIQNQLQAIRYQLGNLFLELYNQCLAKHPNESIYREKILLELDHSDENETNLSSFDLLEMRNEISSGTSTNPEILNKHTSFCLNETSFCLNETSFCLNENILQIQDISSHLGLLPHSIESPASPNLLYSRFCLTKGTLLNDLLLYKEAIEILSKAIKANSSNREAYIERALAYFEIGQIKLALQDYRMAKKLAMSPLFLDKNQKSLDYFHQKSFDYFHHKPCPAVSPNLKNKTAYFQGFVSGAAEGSEESVKEFIPSTLSTLSGIGNFLWASLANIDPVMGMAPEFAKASYYCVDECIEYFNSKSSDEIIEDIIPEFQELVLKWGRASDYDKGKMAGFTMGKYGLGVFVCTKAVTVAKRYRELKRMNVMATLATCESSMISEAKIVEEISRRAVLRQNLFKNGKIKIHWDKQDKHIFGTKNFIPGRSTITISKKRLEELLEKYAGTGEPIGDILPGMAGYKERIDFGEIIGECIYKENNIMTKAMTTRGIIVYDSKGFIHLFPVRP